MLFYVFIALIVLGVLWASIIKKSVDWSLGILLGGIFVLFVSTMILTSTAGTTAPVSVEETSIIQMVNREGIRGYVFLDDMAYLYMDENGINSFAASAVSFEKNLNSSEKTATVTHYRKTFGILLPWSYDKGVGVVLTIPHGSIGLL